MPSVRGTYGANRIKSSQHLPVLLLPLLLCCVAAASRYRLVIARAIKCATVRIRCGANRSHAIFSLSLHEPWRSLHHQPTHTHMVLIKSYAHTHNAASLTQRHCDSRQFELIECDAVEGTTTRPFDGQDRAQTLHCSRIENTYIYRGTTNYPDLRFVS